MRKLSIGGMNAHCVKAQLFLCSALGALYSPAWAVPAQFFTDDLAAGETRFEDVITSADPTAQIFSFDFSASTPSNFSVTEGATTIYVRSFLSGSPTTYNADGFQTWSVSYPGDFDTVIDAGYTLEFFTDTGYTSPFALNAVALQTFDWGTCCTTSNVIPTGVADGSALYVVYNPSEVSESTNLIGNIESSISSTTHFVASIDDSNSFSSVTLAPNGSGEFFGAGGRLLFSFVPIGSVPAGSSLVTVGVIAIPDIDLGGPYTTTQLNAGDVNPAFVGGVLSLAGGGAVTPDFTVSADNGTIDTNGFDSSFSGAVTGVGGLTKTGAGVLTLGGANSFAGGVFINEGVLAVDGDAALGTGGLEIGVGAFQATDSFATAKAFVVNSVDSTIDTQDNDLTLNGAVSGVGGITKRGAGTLVLAGTNSFTGGIRVGEGVIEVDRDGALGTGGVDIGGATFRATDSFSSANSFAASSAESVIDTQSFNLSLTGPLNGAGTLTKIGGGALALSGTSALDGGLNVMQGTLDLRSGGVSTTDIVIMVGARLMGTGDVVGDVRVLFGGEFAPGASPGTMTVTGDVALLSGAEFFVEIDGYGVADGAGNYDRVIVGGPDSVFTAGGIVLPVLRDISGDATNTFSPVIGDVFTVVTAEGGISGEFETLVQPDEGLAPNLRFEIVYNANSIDLIIAPEFYDVMIAGVGRENARRTAHGLDSVRATSGEGPTAPSTTLFSELSSLNQGALGFALQDLSGEIHASGLSAIRRGSRVVRDGFFFDGPSGKSQSGLARCMATERELEAAENACTAATDRGYWIEFFNVKEAVDPDALAIGYDSQHFAVQGGVYLKRDGDRRIDLVGGYSRGDVATNGVGDGFIETWTGAVRGSDWFGNIRADFALGGTLARIESTRMNTLLATGRNQSDTNAFLFHIDVAVSYPILLKNNLLISPFVSAHSEYINAGGFTEAGPAASALSIEKVDMVTGRTRVGSEFTKAFSVLGRPSEASVRTAWQREMQGSSLSRDASLHGAVWEMRSADAGANRAEFSTVWRVDVTSRVTVGLEYKGEYNARVRSHEGVVGVSLNW